MGEWISVEDRKPEPHQMVLVGCAETEMYCAAMRLSRDNYECLEGGELVFWEPTHWMPLPELPKAP